MCQSLCGRPWEVGNEDPDAGFLMMSSEFIYSDVNSSHKKTPVLFPDSRAVSSSQLPHVLRSRVSALPVIAALRLPTLLLGGKQ